MIIKTVRPLNNLNNFPNKKQTNEDICIKTTTEEFPNFLREQRRKRMELIEANKKIKKNYFSENKIKQGEEKINEVFWNESLIEINYSNYIDLQNNLFIPRGVYVYPCKDYFRPEETHEVNFMVKLDSLNQLENLLNQVQDNLMKDFIDFPHNKEDDEKVDNHWFIIWVFVRSVKKIKQLGNNFKLNCEEIISILAKNLNKNFMVVYRIISNFLKGLRKRNINLREIENKILSIKNFRDWYCQICCEYMCKIHFYHNYKMKEIHGTKIYEKEYTKNSGLKSFILKEKSKENENLRIENNMIIDISYDEIEGEGELDNYECKVENDNKNDFRKGCSRNKTELKDDENVTKNATEESERNLLSKIERYDLYLLGCILSSEISDNSCFIAKFIFNSKYECVFINRMKEVIKKSSVEIIDKYLNSVNSNYPKIAEEKLKVLVKPNCKTQLVNTKTKMRMDQKIFIPCSHAGPCKKEICTCISQRGVCEKFCNCSGICAFEFKGCSCKDGCGVISEDASCPCVLDMRECDPDICGCNSHINANSSQDYELFLSSSEVCRNMMINYEMSKKTCLSKSIICDYSGLFALEDIHKNDFICEYMGEILTKNETDRRSIFKDKLGLNYLFTMNDVVDVDAFRTGNGMRYVNHSSFGYENCYARTTMVRGKIRISLYAARDIKRGEELYFDYKMQVKVPWLEKYIRNYSN